MSFNTGALLLLYSFFTHKIKLTLNFENDILINHFRSEKTITKYENQ